MFILFKVTSRQNWRWSSSQPLSLSVSTNAWSQPSLCCCAGLRLVSPRRGLPDEENPGLTPWHLFIFHSMFIYTASVLSPQTLAGLEKPCRSDFYCNITHHPSDHLRSPNRAYPDPFGFVTISIQSISNCICQDCLGWNLTKAPHGRLPKVGFTFLSTREFRSELSDASDSVAWVTKDRSSFRLPALPSFVRVVFLTITEWEETGRAVNRRQGSAESFPSYQRSSSFCRRYPPQVVLCPLPLAKTTSHDILQLQRMIEELF